VIPVRNAIRSARPRDFVVLGLVLSALAGVAAVLELSGLRFQHTGSLPRGIYQEVGGSPSRGVTAVWCLPDSTARWARQRGYLNQGECPGDAEPIGKVILAVAGDTVDLSAAGVSLNGRAVAGTALPSRDSRGRPAPHAGYRRYVIAPGEVWLWSPYTARSFDSRVFGPVPLSALVAVVRPMWTF
jgi:conjugative transfer signal peptidase TraF